MSNPAATAHNQSSRQTARGDGWDNFVDRVQLARALGGEIIGGQVLAPGPGHSPRDRSLAIRPSAQSPFGFIAHSHAGDDWRACRDYVLAKLGRPQWEPRWKEKTRQRPPQGD